MATASSQSQIGYVQLESAYGTVPHSTGTATVANGDAFRLIKLVTKADTGLISRQAKTTTLSQTAGVLGKKSGNWSALVELAGSGAAGTAPDIDAFLQAAFGKAGTVSAGVSVSYGIEDASPSLAIYNFRDPSTIEQLLALGAVVNSMRLSITQESSTIEFSGPCRYVIDHDGFAGLDATAKGGLTSFPARPSAPTYAGVPALGLFGSATLDSAAYTTLRSLNINVEFARSLPSDILFNGAYPGPPQQVTRRVTVDWSMTDEDTAALKAMKVKARAKTGFPLSFVIGATAGNIWTVGLASCQATSPDYDDSQPSWVTSFSAVANASSATAKDEMTLVCT